MPAPAPAPAPTLTLALALALPLLACTGDAGDPRTPSNPDGTWWDGRYPGDCAGTEGDDAYLCAEQLFWQSLQFEPDTRADTHAALDRLAAALETSGTLDDARLAILYWRKVQLASATVSELMDSSLTTGIYDDLERATALAPDKLEIESWFVLFNLVRAWGSGDPARFAEAEALLWAAYDKDPDYVLFAVMGVGASLPMSTGVPRKIADAIERYRCDTHDFCDRETPWVPYQQAGAAYLFGEIYARVGDRDRARTQFAAALEAPRADTWPYRELAAYSRDNVDALVAKFAAVGDDAPVLDLMEQNGRATCLPCHGPANGFKFEF